MTEKLLAYSKPFFLLSEQVLAILNFSTNEENFLSSSSLKVKHTILTLLLLTSLITKDFINPPWPCSTSM